MHHIKFSFDICYEGSVGFNPTSYFTQTRNYVFLRPLVYCKRREGKFPRDLVPDVSKKYFNCWFFKLQMPITFYHTFFLLNYSWAPSPSFIKTDSNHFQLYVPGIWLNRRLEFFILICFSFSSKFKCLILLKTGQWPVETSGSTLTNLILPGCFTNTQSIRKWWIFFIMKFNRIIYKLL